MKKFIALALICALTVCEAAVSKTVRPGGIVTLADTTEHIITLSSDYTVSGCNWVKIKVISAASGVKLTSVATSTSSPIDWTNYQASVAGSTVTLQYCAASTFPYQKDVTIRAIGPAGAVLEFDF